MQVIITLVFHFFYESTVFLYFIMAIILLNCATSKAVKVILQ